MRGTRPLQLAFLLALSLALSIPFSAQAPKDNALTNADIIGMVKAGIPDDIIVREIQMSRTDFGTSAAALIELKKHGASERILGAVLDSRSSTSNFVSGAPTAPSIPEQSISPRPHHLPSFEADVRVNSAKHEKISVGQNHIKVEQSGVPLFSLKWKENSRVQ
jgi:hypothetical protein